MNFYDFLRISIISHIYIYLSEKIQYTDFTKQMECLWVETLISEN